jgi:pimeloyl-ACP methyl ester carboxylesterase
VSSLRSGEALRPLFSAAEKIRLIDFFNEELLKKAIVKGARLVLPLNEKRIILIVEMLDQFDGVFYKWAMNEVLHWDGADCLCPVYHIHGDKDELFPVGNVKDAVIIKGGTHLMVTLRAEEISKTLKKWICDEF